MAKTPDYSLIGETARHAVERGLAEADWYQCPIPRETLRSLLERRNGPAIRDTMLWFALIIATGWLVLIWWPTPWFLLPYVAYSVLYASTSDARWHEAGHGTPFRSDWMNVALYEIASFMVMRESTVWRWSHNRHHSDTIIVGRDPEIAVPRPPKLWSVLGAFFNLEVYPSYFRKLIIHSLGRMDADERTFIPEGEFKRIYWKARACVAIYATVAGICAYQGSLLLLLFVGLPNLFGSWLMVIYGFTQHAGLAENVLDHRLNCRTVKMNALNRFLYWNMNYHLEHHMFPLVPYHALPKLHEAVKDDMPAPYNGLVDAWREIVPTLLRQTREPDYHIKRRLPAPKAAPRVPARFGEVTVPDECGWIEACPSIKIRCDDVIRFDHGTKTYAIARDSQHRVFAIDGICSHGSTHLADGFVKEGTIECPKHNGRFNLADGSPARAPICRGLSVYPTQERNGRVFVNVSRRGSEPIESVHQFRVVSNTSVATFIKELVVEPVGKIEFTPGDYLQFDIPAYEQIAFQDFEIPEPYAAVWRRHRLFELVASNPSRGRRNKYSLACDGSTERLLRLNVRIATPPPGQDCPPGVGSTYIFSLKPGQLVTAVGPFGKFHIKPTQKEMVYIGGETGMAPLRAHLSHLFETQRTARKVSFWYGARTRQELFYTEYFSRLAAEYPNFTFHTALSAPVLEDGWTGESGFIHEVVERQFLRNHLSPKSVEYYLCGPPLMIKACVGLLTRFGVPRENISADAF